VRGTGSRKMKINASQTYVAVCAVLNQRNQFIALFSIKKTFSYTLLFFKKKKLKVVYILKKDS
jgi:hypothetical protein